MSLQKIVHAVRGEARPGAKHIDFAARIEATAKLEPDSALGYLRKLVEAGPADEDLTRAEAISVLILAHPAAAEEMGIQSVEALIQTATALEESGSSKAAIALLEAGFAASDESPAVLRAIETLRLQQRREKRQLAELVSKAEAATNQRDRSLARDLIEQIRSADPKHVAIGRLESRLEAQAEDGKRRWLQRGVVLAGIAALSGVVWLGFDYEQKAREAFAGLPAADANQLEATSQRLAELESFVKRYPVWTGALEALEERSELRVLKLALEGDEQERQALEAEQEEERLRKADFAAREGKRLFDTGDPQGAIQKFQEALDLAGDGWDRADRVRRDIEAVLMTINPEESK